MPDPETLLLIGHGSARYPGAGDWLRLHARSLRNAGHEVREAFLNGSPSVQEVVASLPGTSVCVVPFFMEDGYFTRVAIPRALAGVAARFCPPIGVHPDIPLTIRELAAAACQRHALVPRQTAILLIGHGSASAPGRALALHNHADAVAADAAFARVLPACLEEAPFVADVLAGLRGSPVVAVGYFANQGGHVRDDVPALLEAENAERKGGPPDLHFAGCVAEHPAVTRIILDQARFGRFEGD